MINRFKIYLSYFKYIKEHEFVSYNDFINSILEGYVLEKEMPSFYIDDNGKNVYRIFYFFYSNNSFLLYHKSSVLERPEGISQDDVFKIVSFIKNALDSLNIPMSKQIMILERFLVFDFGFKDISDNVIDKKIVDLYLFTGKPLDLVRSKFYENYFSWRVNEVSKSDIYSIYENSSHKLELRF